MADLVGAIDQGTTSTRFMVFDHGGNEVGRHQLEHEQIMPQPGWVEHNPIEIWERASAVAETAMNELHLTAGDLAAVGITNQRETTVVWDRETGRPYANAIVWQDTRTKEICDALAEFTLSRYAGRGQGEGFLVPPNHPTKTPTD
jgi:glycerol kinase